MKTAWTCYIILRGLSLSSEECIWFYLPAYPYTVSFFVINLPHRFSLFSYFSFSHPLGVTFFFVWTWRFLLGICRHSALYLPFMYPHSMPIETGTLPCDGDGVFTILPCFKALNSKKLSFLCKQVTFKLCGMLLCHLTLRKHLRVHCVLKPCLGL